MKNRIPPLDTSILPDYSQLIRQNDISWIDGVQKHGRLSIAAITTNRYLVVIGQLNVLEKQGQR